MHSEEESLSGQRLFKDHSWRIAENSWVSGSENLKKKLSNSTYITTCCLGGFQEKFSSLIQKQTPAYSVIRHDWNFKWTGFYGQMKQKNELFSSKTLKMGLVNTGIKVPHVYNEIYCCIFNVVGLYFCWRSWTSCLDTWHHGFYQIPTDKKITSDWLC